MAAEGFSHAKLALESALQHPFAAPTGHALEEAKNLIRIAEQNLAQIEGITETIKKTKKQKENQLKVINYDFSIHPFYAVVSLVPNPKKSGGGKKKQRQPQQQHAQQAQQHAQHAQQAQQAQQPHQHVNINGGDAGGEAPGGEKKNQRKRKKRKGKGGGNNPTTPAAATTEVKKEAGNEGGEAANANTKN